MMIYEAQLERVKYIHIENESRVEKKINKMIFILSCDFCQQKHLDNRLLGGRWSVSWHQLNSNNDLRRVKCYGFCVKYAHG